MKRKLEILSLVVVVAMLTGFGFAVSGGIMHVAVPFDFYAGSRLLPAGEYTFEMTAGTTPTGSLVTVLTREGAALCMLGARPGTDAAAGRLVFHKYEDTYFLSSVAIQGFKADVAMPDEERELSARLRGRGNVVFIARK